jgi:glycosyltransferase involved in cell wall biosynthesis
LAPTDVPALIYAPHGWAPPASNGTIRVHHFPEMPPYLDMMEEMARASVVAIALLPGGQLAGLSELNDALALGKPIVMTRTPHIDLDLERIGCGHVIEPGDVEGWRSTLVRLHGDPELRREMGRRGREFAEREWNTAISGRQFVEGFTSLPA